MATDIGSGKSPSPPPSVSSVTATTTRDSAEERSRTLELARYFSSAAVTPVQHNRDGDVTAEQQSLPYRASDINLTALTQLGATRLDCDRAFISLIDSSHQYIISEATRTTALLPRGSEVSSADGLYLGVRALELSFGVCPQTIDVFTSVNRTISSDNVSADNTHYVIRDFQADSHFSTRPYVAGWPHMRSYAEVPLTTLDGIVIGSYCVVDTKPRDFDSKAIDILATIATCIIDHLDLRKAKLELGRVEQLMHGLGSYVNGYSGLQEYQPKSIPNQRRAVPKLLRSATDVSSPTTLRFSVDSSSPGPSQRNSSLTAASSAVQSLTTAATQFNDSKSASDAFSQEMEPSQAQWWQQSDESDVDGYVDENDAALRKVRQAISRASDLVRQSMEVQGVVFVDASCITSYDTQNQLNVIDSGQVEPDTAPDDAICDLLGHSTEDQYNTIESGFKDHIPRVNRRLLKRLLLNYPFGNVFSYDEFGHILSPLSAHDQGNRIHPSSMRLGKGDLPPSPPKDSSVRDDAVSLHQFLPRARSIFVLPLWNFQTERWFAASIGWSTDPTRILDVADLNYLSAFGHSIMAEVSRIEAAALSRSKSDFISSISHELRSPLHGILAGVEMLRGSQTSIMDSSTLDTIDACGNMLLDTMNHLLDYAKINNLASRQDTNIFGKQSGELSPLEDGLSRTFTVNLANLVQDVVEGIYLGYSADQLTTQDAGNSTRESSTIRPRGEAIRSGAVAVLVDIDFSTDWNFRTEVGTWKRIIMNLFGNALKFTTAGEIKVKLNLVTHDASTYILLEVFDTGQGISAEYLTHKLFTPFAQETHLSVGPGLGLTIVKQLVDSMNGTIDVHSKVQSGTGVSIWIPIGKKIFRAPATTSENISTKEYEHMREHTLFVPELSPGEDTIVQQRDLAIRAMVVSTAKNLLGMDIVTDLTASESSSKNQHMISLLRQPASNGAGASSWSVLRLDSKTKNADSVSESVVLHSLFTPRKISQALLNALNDPRRPETEFMLTNINQESTSGSGGAKDGHTDPVATVAVPSCVGEEPPDRPLTNHDLEPPLASETVDQPRKTVLFVDDNEINLKILSASVRRIECAYDAAIDGLQAVEMYKAANGSFDLIFMDLSMPVMDGYTATREIREHERMMHLRKCYIVALTALGSADAKQKAFSHGVDEFISKPVKAAVIQSLVERHCNS